MNRRLKKNKVIWLFSRPFLMFDVEFNHDQALAVFYPN